MERVWLQPTAGESDLPSDRVQRHLLMLVLNQQAAPFLIALPKSKQNETQTIKTMHIFKLDL